MTFDWFRRQYDQDAEGVPTAETDLAAPEAATSEATLQDEAAPDVAEDYLSWAKVAYQNIQKRQQTEAIADVEAPTPTTPEVDTANEDTIDAVELASSAVIERTAPEVAETPTTPLPFWAQSEADRQQRLERLKENAIVEPEPAIAPVTAASTTAIPATTPLDSTELVLDEGFLWSSEILAAQGRRPDQISLEEITWLNRLRQGLDKTRRGLINQLRSIVGQGPLNDDAVDEIESVLLQADVGVAATDAIIHALQSKLREEVLPPDAALSYLKQILRDILDAPLENAKSRFFAPEDETLNIWLITGVNGAGKTTTIGKLAHIAQKSGYNCLIAAADTFRAAAVEQVKVWGSRSGVEVIANPGQNTDPAAVVFDAIAAAQSRGTDLLLVDTAGRLQNKKNLMDELSKIRRIIDKKSENAVVESLLVLDATLGQNGLRQAEVFSEAAQLSGVILTKLDGTAKGGIALAIVQQLGLPIRFIGAGEGIEDLRPFSSYEFVEALLNG
ncbi:signal recognition particle-docking protein FtsY [Stenomitos frigidus]|uniref:Signal recognition particle receptor FtsY n=1 Tax=Stenomitos frigidus ULC18 TaxID=2107698 RepID=A0A2T1E4Z0_9CYAN|nr:signal recognition particle-docking protein FtsY [Stenomitos frigidus]PSB27822.1 signal recognition particle-docking protein FtsY [Stenomitos frigidus ULC18]